MAKAGAHTAGKTSKITSIFFLFRLCVLCVCVYYALAGSPSYGRTTAAARRGVLGDDGGSGGGGLFSARWPGR